MNRLQILLKQLHNIYGDFQINLVSSKIFQQLIFQHYNLFILVLHGQVTKFDAFLSFCETDRPEAKELVRILENIYEFRICIDVRDLIPGASTFFTIADIMAERYWKEKKIRGLLYFSLNTVSIAF